MLQLQQLCIQKGKQSDAFEYSCTRSSLNGAHQQVLALPPLERNQTCSLLSQAGTRRDRNIMCDRLGCVEVSCWILSERKMFFCFCFLCSIVSRKFNRCFGSCSRRFPFCCTHSVTRCLRLSKLSIVSTTHVTKTEPSSNAVRKEQSLPNDTQKLIFSLPKIVSSVAACVAPLPSQKRFGRVKSEARYFVGDCTTTVVCCESSIGWGYTRHIWRSTYAPDGHLLTALRAFLTIGVHICVTGAGLSLSCTASPGMPRANTSIMHGIIQ